VTPKGTGRERGSQPGKGDARHVSRSPSPGPVPRRPLGRAPSAGAARRELDKALIRQLASRRWIDEHQQVLITGATGTGKSFLACALAHHACRRGYRACYRRASRLFDDLKLGSYVRLLGKLARNVLVLDDWGLAPVQDQERRDLLEILEDRYGTRSTIVTSQLQPGHWHDYLGEPTLADAICDRLLHNAHRIVLRSVAEKGGQARQLSGRTASLRSDHDPRSARSRWTDLSVQLRRYTQSEAGNRR
jgi:hypothetical protein